MVQIVPTRVKGESPKTNLVMVIMVTRGVVEVSKREIKTPMQTKTRAVGTAGGVNTTLRRDTILLPAHSRDKTKVRTLPTTAWLPLSMMLSLICYLEVQPLVPIREEFLHTPSNLASHHLNVTVIVQDKDRTVPASELRAAGKAVMDTANYSDNFIYMIECNSFMISCS